MNIINVTPGLIPIPPNGWGATEKIIWELHQNIPTYGHTSKILYLDEVPDDADVVHIHVANLALIAHSRGIPYYFTMHDHHAYLYGKESPVYKENLLAMKHAIRSFVPARYLVEYFENIPEYFSHGVNTLQFYPPEHRNEHKLLCVANNGYIHNQSEDRKGFGYAITAAQALGLPITIAGPSNNKQYFERNPSQYDKLTVLYDLTETELVKLYQEHTIFVHPSELEAGHPNLTLLEALASGLPVVGTLEDNTTLTGFKKITRNVGQIIDGIKEVIERYTEYSTAARTQAERLDWKYRTKELLNIYKTDRPTMRDELIKHYTTTKQLNASVRPTVKFHCINGMFVEILGNTPKKYEVKFINKTTNEIIYTSTIENNCWAKVAVEYYVDWQIEITDLITQKKFYYELDLTNKRVYIALESKSLGDTLAWIPYVEEFRKKHKCTVICSTFWNKFFNDTYTNVTFVEPGQTVHNIIAMYKIGIFYKDKQINYNMHPVNPMEYPLQQVSSDILGLTFREIQPKIPQPTVESSKQVTIAIHSTAQAKYWNNPTGWQDVVDWLNNRGYTVKLLSSEHDGYMGNTNPKGIIQHPAGPIESVMEELKKSKAFIGISSGLSWLGWALNVPVVLISGFSDERNEMQDCIRISAPKNKCSDCWGRHLFDPGDWNWCPDHKNTPRQFECSKSITSEMVIKELEKIL